MKINHDLIRKFIRVFGISLFGIVCFLKFKKLIESGGKEIDPTNGAQTASPVGYLEEDSPISASLDDDDDEYED